MSPTTVPANEPKADSINRGTAAILLSQIIALVLTWAAQLVVANNPFVRNSEGSYANYQIILSVVLLLNHLVHYGLPSAVGKYVATDRDYAGYFLSKGWRLQAYFAGGLMAIALLLAPFIVLGVIHSSDYFLPYFVAIISVPAYAFFNQRTSVMGGLRLFTPESMIYTAYAVVRFAWVFGTVMLMCRGLPQSSACPRIRWRRT